MTRSLRLALAAGTLAALSLAPAELRAQAATAPAPAAPAATTDSLAFPRRFVEWTIGFQGDSVFAHSGAALKETMKSAEGVNAMASRIAARFGVMQSTDAEVQFDDGALKVYIAAVRFAQAQEPGAFVVAYSPATQIVERANFAPLAQVKQRFPQAKLP